MIGPGNLNGIGATSSAALRTAPSAERALGAVNQPLPKKRIAMAANDSERQEINTLEFRHEIKIDAPLDIAFQAVLDELGPEAQMMDGASLKMKIEPWPGGRWYRDLGN